MSISSPLQPTPEERQRIMVRLLDESGPLPAAARLQIAEELVRSGPIELELPRRRGPLELIAGAIRRYFCGHGAAWGERVPGSMPPVFVRHCPRCNAVWPERR